MNAITPTNRTAALSDLQLHPLNPRQDHDAADIEALAKSISINGLMQNLNVFDEAGSLGVVAGGRRLAALQLLASGAINLVGGPEIDMAAIPINVTADPMIAHSWAGSEGATQRPLHPADEIRAYAQMQDQGLDNASIAMAFGQTEIHVQRRLKLAHLTDASLGALRRNEITLDVAKVLTLSSSMTAETAALELATDRGYNADQLRHHFSSGKVASNSNKVIYIGLDLYKAEGGTLDEDLFEDRCFLHDEDLVDTLFKAKLAKAAEDMQTTGRWAQVVPVFDGYVWNHTGGMDRIFRKATDLPDGDAQRLAELHEIGDFREFDKDEAIEFDTLEQRERGDYDDDECAKATVFVSVNHKGELETSEPHVRRAKAGDSDTGADGTATQLPAKPPITQGGVDDLRRIELLSLQTKLIKQPELALDLLAFQLWHEFPSWAGTFNIQASDQNSTPSDISSVTIDKRITGEDETADATGDDLGAAFDAFLDLGKKHRNTVLTTLLTRTVNAPFGSKINKTLMSRLEVNPRSVWTPTAANFFKACRSDYLDSIWRKLVITEDTAEDMDRFAKLKVGEKRIELENLFGNASTQEALGLSRDQVAAIDAWLPAELERKD